MDAVLPENTNAHGSLGDLDNLMKFKECMLRPTNKLL